MPALRILFSTTRGTGHFRPLLPFAKECRRRGHSVAFAARSELSERITSEGFRYFPLAPPDQQALEAVWARARGLAENDAIDVQVKEAFGGVIARAAMPAMQDVLSCWKPDLVVRESAELSGIVCAEVSGIPHVRVEVHAAYSEEQSSRASIAALELLREAAGLKADKGKSLLKEPAFSFFPPALDGMVERHCAKTFRVAPAPFDKARNMQSAEWETGDDRPLVYITFGTEIQKFEHAKSIYRIAIEAVADLPVRALVTTGTALPAEATGPIPSNTMVLPWVPQNDVFPHASAMVHHGGSGTLLGGLAAGVPMVITPLFADQPHNAAHVHNAGAGLALPDPAPETLRSAIECVLTSEKFRENAQRFATELKQLPDIETAVDTLLASADR